ncbi:MAG TPA: ribonuclease HII [Clostridiales bacterium]|nr:ribonuclease HII [Clostridiales bacterium]
MDEKTREKVNFDRGFLSEKVKYIAGVDEVGRGPLAGPVVCCAVIMPIFSDETIDGVDDSKKLSAKKREFLAEEIKKKAVCYKICRVENDEIDRINILEATKKCMKACVEGLEVKPDLVITDALEIDVSVPQKDVIKGDATSYTVGAASIVAKVYRDKLMDEYDLIYPAYGFKNNKGYGTKAHTDALKETGYCPIHRKTFIKNFSASAAKEPPSDF